MVNSQRNKFIAALDLFVYLLASIFTAVITFGYYCMPDSDVLPVARKCRGCGEVFARGKGRGRDARSCRRCDYDLTGNESGVCPECGTEIEKTP